MSDVECTVTVVGVLPPAETTIKAIKINGTSYPVKKGDFNTVRGRALYAALLAWFVAHD